MLIGLLKIYICSVLLSFIIFLISWKVGKFNIKNIAKAYILIGFPFLNTVFVFAWICFGFKALFKLIKNMGR